MPLPADVRFFDSTKRIESHRKNLPHRQQWGTTYFVTFRLADSIPQAKLGALKSERAAWMQWHPEPWTIDVETEYHRRFSGRMEAWLDQQHGSCLLRDPQLAALVSRSLAKFDLVRYALHAWVIMPNHVHVLFSLCDGYRLEQVMKSWKGVSARRINERTGHSGPLWMPDYFDRFVRDERHFWNCARYIRRNPEKAKLRTGAFSLFESKAVKSHLDALQHPEPPNQTQTNDT